MSAAIGWLGEVMARLGLWLRLDKPIYKRFHNVIVPSSNGTTEIDHVLVSRYGIFVIETKSPGADSPRQLLSSLLKYSAESI